jgi:LmbE family N-acetylglucosaminyl deacetylase
MEKPMSTFNLTRIENGKKLRTQSIGELLKSRDIKSETWLLVSPHDDDLAIGAGLLMQAGVEAGANVQVLVVTDGSQGYCTMEQKDQIVEIRRAEMLESFQILGIPHAKVHTIGYPDGGLAAFQGRRPARGAEMSIAGHVGLQNAFTYFLRHLKPDRVFVPTHTDLHPDHQITNNELMISIFHAGGAIWPDLGEPIKQTPAVYELAVYCDFVAPPNLEIRGDAAAFETKLKSIAAYRSQAQIAAMVDGIRKAGAYEYVREVEFRLYSAETYKPLFA